MSPEEVVAHHQGLVKMFARRYATHRWPEDDLVQEANLALWRYASKKEGDDLQGVASYIVKGAVVKVITEDKPTAARANGGAGHRHEPTQLFWIDGASEESRKRVEGLLGNYPSAEEELLSDDEHDVLGFLEVLTSRERSVVQSRMEGASTAQIGQALGVTSQTVRNVLRAVQKKLPVGAAHIPQVS